MSSLNIRASHYTTATPLFELAVASHSTVGDLRRQIESRMATEDECFLRVFSKWYLEVELCNRKKFVEISVADEADTLASMGITDESSVFLDGPLIDSVASVGQALAMVNVQCRQSLYRQNDALQKVAALVTRMADQLTFLCKSIDPKPLRAQYLDSAMGGCAEIAACEAAAFAEIDQSIQKAVWIDKGSEGAQRYMAKYPNRPLKALWRSLTSKSFSRMATEVPMAIVLSDECGIEKRSTKDEGEATGSGWVITEGATPLILAAHADRYDVVQALVDLGADVTAVDSDAESHFTALHSAANCDNVRAVELLLAKGADVNAIASFGITPLHRAAAHGYRGAIEALVSKGANLNALSTAGANPLARFEMYGVVKCPKEDVGPIRALLTPKHKKK